MVVQNDSRGVITEFVFIGFDTLQRPLVVGVVLLLLYIFNLIANMANIFIILMYKCLHQPMFLLICNLAFIDLIYTTSSCPTMIANLVVGYKTISYLSCMVQMIIYHVSSAMVMFGLAVMATDRFIAIGSPLHYHSIMTNFRCILIIIAVWVAVFAIYSMLPASIGHLPICFSTVRYIFCDYAAITRTTCANPEPLFNNASIISTVVIFGTFSFICLSYYKIAIVIIRMSSKNDKRKALNTCLTHFIVMVCYYAPKFTLIVLTRIGVVLTLEERNGLMVGSILGPSLVNPFIYCFRTKEIRTKLLKIVQLTEQRQKICQSSLK